VLVCKMEKVFPPGWFNAMQHLLVHLPWEAKVRGPLQRDHELLKYVFLMYQQCECSHDTIPYSRRSYAY
jgi:hypothetical protein